MIKPRQEIELLRPYVPGKPIDDVKREFGLTDIIKLASNENPLGCSQKAKQAVIDALEDCSIYPDGNATLLRETLSHKLGFSKESFIFGVGSDEIISMIAKTYIGYGDEAITCTPSFPQYKAATISMGGTMIEVPLKNYAFDLDGILNAITDKTKVIFIANPNNPTGTIVTKEEQIAFMKKVPDSILVVWDEAYNEYIKDSLYPDTLSLFKDYDNIILLHTFSKIFGLASLRVGYGIASEEIIGYINRIRQPFNISTASQVAAVASINDEAFIEESYTLNEKSKNYTYKKCQELGYDYIETYGNFVMIDFKIDSMELFEALQKEGMILRPGFYFGMPTYQRVTLGTIPQMERLFELVQKISKAH